MTSKLSGWVFAGCWVLGCTPEAERESERCRGGSLEACERACDLGRSGEDGCMRAGLLADLAIDPKPGSHEQQERVLRAYEKACEHGVAEGCKTAVARLDAPHTPVPPYPLDSLGEAPWKIADDKALDRRERALVRGCSLDTALCRSLGDRLVGVAPERAREAFRKGCAATDGPEECMRKSEQDVNDAESHKALCAERRSYGCARLERVLWKHDQARAARLMRDHCLLRGTRHLPTCLGDAIVAASVESPSPSSDGFGGRPPLTEEKLKATLDKARVRLGKASGITQTEAERMFSQMQPTWRTCYENGLRHNPNLQGRITIRFEVDGFGYPWSVSNAGSDVPDWGVIVCVLRALEETKVEAERGTVVTVPLFVSPD